jgi:hypothetical protein
MVQGPKKGFQGLVGGLCQDCQGSGSRYGSKPDLRLCLRVGYGSRPGLRLYSREGYGSRPGLKLFSRVVNGSRPGLSLC